jgi:hypothetical protein
METCISTVKQPELSALTLNKIFRNCHVTEENGKPVQKTPHYFFEDVNTPLILCKNFQCLRNDFNLLHDAVYFFVSGNYMS